MTPLHVITLKDTDKLSISNGNRKTGHIITINTLPASGIYCKKDGTPICNVSGTCGRCSDNCESLCYACRDLRQHHNATAPAWGKNTLILREKPEQYEADIIEALEANREKGKKGLKTYTDKARIHSAGELESTNELRIYNRIATQFPEVKFALYTKNFDILLDAFAGGLKLAKNLIVRLSEWNDKNGISNISKWAQGKQGAHVAKVLSLPRFVYDDTGKSTYVHCPAVRADGSRNKGINCNVCGRCFRNVNTAVYPH